MSDSSEISSEESFVSGSEEESDQMEVTVGVKAPHQDEPLADSDDENENEDVDDPDMLAPATLAARKEKQDPVETWCKCGFCRTDELKGALEFRCCQEVLPAVGKLIFDGSIERIKCVTQHEDYVAITNSAVLRLSGPLLRDKNGNPYKCPRLGLSDKSFNRAVSYRLLVRWMCGYMGWDNGRPLSACVYHNIRTRFPSQSRGYLSSSKRCGV